MQTETLNITILGSGTSTGIPVIGCPCDVCHSNHPGNLRSRCSALLSYGKYNLLIDTSTDLRQQALRENIRHIDAVFYTHSHADHLHGIDDLRSFNIRSQAPIPLYGSKATLTTIKNSFSYIFNQTEPTCQPNYIPKLKLNPFSQPLNIFGLQIIPIPLIHGSMPTYGYRCGSFAYLTDCNAIPADSMRLLEDLEILILDGLRFTPHNTHFNIPQALEVAQKIGAKQTFLTHLSHEVDHPRHDRQLPQGVNLAFDGQQLSCCAHTIKPQRA